jgi:hypothetical protein
MGQQASGIHDAHCTTYCQMEDGLYLYWPTYAWEIHVRQLHDTLTVKDWGSCHWLQKELPILMCTGDHKGPEH